MSSASNAAGFVGRFGQASFTAITSATKTPVNKKFFKSRNARTPNTSTTSSSATKNRKKEESNVLVAVRVRPALKRQGDEDEDRCVLDAVENQGEVFVNNGSKAFQFDRVLGQKCDQERVYEAVVKPIVDRFLNASEHQEDSDASVFLGCHNAAVLAYGQTGSGKTYTMGTNHLEKEASAEHSSAGVIPRVVNEIFARMESDSRVKVSYMEVQNDVYDLLNGGGRKVPLPIGLKNNHQEFVVKGLTSKSVESVEEALEYLQMGNQLRSTASTAQNENSSRSHAVFRVTVTDGRETSRSISLVDLAGSESSDKAQTSGDRMKEGININKSLSALGRCVLEICQGSKIVPFRDSSLTMVLRECFVGDGMTAMIVCVSPLASDMDETVKTLRFADQVKSLQKPPIPPHLIELARSNAEAHQSLHRLIPPTPANFRRRQHNHTIETPTPTKIRKFDCLPPRMNSSMNTPAAAVGNMDFMTSTSARGFASKATSLERIEDEDMLGDISSIHGNYSFSSTSASVVPPSAPPSGFSPMLRKLREDMKQDLKEAVEEAMKSQLEATKSQLEATFGFPHLKTIARKNSRMTSSPHSRRCSPRLNKENMEEEEEAEETILAGPMFTTVRKKMRQSSEQGPATPRGPLCDVTNLRKNKHLKLVSDTASPELGKKESPPRVSVEEMAKSMGLNFNSPGLLFTTSKKGLRPTASASAAPTPSIKRSMRRTTMLRPEMEASLRNMQQQQSTDMSRRRSTRIAATTNSSAAVAGTSGHHNNGRFQFMDQARHNAMILDLLNTGSVSVLSSSFPGVGPKTALVLHKYRELNNGFSSLEELKKVGGLSKAFYNLFCARNQIVL